MALSLETTQFSRIAFSTEITDYGPPQPSVRYGRSELDNSHIASITPTYSQAAA